MSFLFNLDLIGKIIISLILFVFVLSFVVNLLIRKKYVNILADLEDRFRKRDGKFKTDLLNKVVEDYKNTASSSYSDVNTQAIIEKCFSLWLRGLTIGERLIKNSVSILITLGLLGTFIGLTLAVGDLAKAFDEVSMSDLLENSDLLVNGLVEAIGGMAIAFVTSLSGIACSILLTILFTVVNAEEAKETLMVHIEEYLDNSMAVVVSKDKETEYTMMNRILKETFVEFGEKIEGTLKSTVEDFGDKMKNVVMDVSLSSKTLDNTVDKFDLSLKNFALNMKDLTEFNANLRNNIERMDVNFIKVTEAMVDTSKIIVDNYSVIENFSKDIKSAAEEMTSYNSQVIKDIGSLVEELKVSVSSVKELGDAIKSDLNNRTHEMKDYQEKFSSLMSKLSQEINTLGQTTSQAFSESLKENSRTIAQETAGNIQNVLKELFITLDAFKENEKLFAKTIASLPDQTLTYNEAAAAKIGKELKEIKESLDKK